MRTLSGLLPAALTVTGTVTVTLTVFLSTMFGPAASAGTVRIEQTADRLIAVIADGATLSEVVGTLGETYEFRLDHKGATKVGVGARDEQSGGDGRYLDGRYEGTLRAVLERLLAQESYFIEHAAGSKSGIARVVLYNVRAQALAPQAVTNPTGPVSVQRQPVSVGPVVPAVVPPVSRVQPVPTVVPVRPNLPPPPVRVAPGQTAAAGAAPVNPPGNPYEARKRGGGVIQ